MQAIKVHEGPSGAAFVLVALDTGHAQLILVGASKIDEAAWDEAVRFCWVQGWEPRQDDPDVYIGAIDTEFYVLTEVDEMEIAHWDAEEPERVHGDG